MNNFSKFCEWCQCFTALEFFLCGCQGPYGDALALFGSRSDKGKRFMCPCAQESGLRLGAEFAIMRSAAEAKVVCGGELLPVWWLVSFDLNNEVAAKQHREHLQSAQTPVAMCAGQISFQLVGVGQAITCPVWPLRLGS